MHAQAHALKRLLIIIFFCRSVASRNVNVFCVVQAFTKTGHTRAIDHCHPILQMIENVKLSVNVSRVKTHLSKKQSMVQFLLKEHAHDPIHYTVSPLGSTSFPTEAEKF